MRSPDLPKDQILSWMRKGLTNKQIAELLAGDGLYPTPQALSAIRRRAGLPPLRATYKALIPWMVAPEHRSLHTAAMLRLEARVRAGEELRGRNLDYWTSWRRRIDSPDEGPPLVVTYVRESEDGWIYLARTPEDTDIIRVIP
jgi:hypothetical protein